MESSFIQGTFIKDNACIEVVGTELSGYKYKFIKSLEDEKEDYTGYLPVFIMDYSWSMINSKSALSVTESSKNVCKDLFEKGCKEILLIYFGRTAYSFVVNKDNYQTDIDCVLKIYFQNPDLYNKSGKFQIDATVPSLGFNEMLNYLSTCKKEYSKVSITFMTDGQFNIYDCLHYEKEWAIISNKMNSICDFTINCIGYQNDYLRNIKSMKDAFDKYKVPFSYLTIKDPKEIQKSMENIYEELNFYNIPKIQLDENLCLSQYNCIYSFKKLFVEIESIDIINEATLNKCISEDWIKMVILFEIEIGLKEIETMSKFKTISNLCESQQLKNDRYKELVIELIPYFNEMHKKYFELKGKYKSIKSRNIYAWKSLFEKMTSFSKLFSDIQILISDDLNEKKAFEIATKISVSDRHMRTLQRRKITNEINKVTKDFDIKINNNDPLILECFFPDKNQKISKKMDSKLEHLNEYFTCAFSLDEWENMLETCLGIPFKYNWKESDDWTPSRAFIEFVSASSFISMEGYSEMQLIFGCYNSSPEHEKLYGKDSQYIKSAHDKGNAFIPVAIDPFFIVKLNLIKERLGHMLAGSSLAFRNGHILIYVAILRKCFDQLLNTNTEKLRHIIMLLLNTFKLLANRLNVIYDKDNTPILIETILYNIVIGNTAPYLFSGSWDTIVFCLISSETQFNKALEIYNKERADNITIMDFKKRIWEMILRFLLIAKFKKREMWEDSKTWDLLDSKIIEEKLKEEGIDSLTNYLMSVDKVISKPEKINNDLVRLRESKSIKLFKLVIFWADSLNDSVWDNFNKSYLPMKLKENESEMILSKHFSNDQLIDYYNYWTYWECYAYGTKDCFPMRTTINEISRIVSNNINRKFSEDLSGILADIKELKEYKEKSYEARYLPMTFTLNQQNLINNLFIMIYTKQINEEEFKINIKHQLGKHYSEMIDEVFMIDKIDVLHNLYEYCKTRKHSIIIKNDSKLPFSCPANPSSPYFLQSMTDNEFMQYYEPLGFRSNTKKYYEWIFDFHPYMSSKLTSFNDEDSFTKEIINYVNSNRCTNERNLKHFESEIKHFYNQFKNESNDTISTSPIKIEHTLPQKNSNYYYK